MDKCKTCWLKDTCGLIPISVLCKRRFYLSLFILGILVMLGCGHSSNKSADNAFQEKFGVSLLETIVVEHYQWSGPGMDHAYIWVLTPADKNFIQDLVSHSSLKSSSVMPPKSKIMAKISPSAVKGLRGSWPSWWDQPAIESLPEAYFRDGQNMFWRVWVDRNNNRIFVQYFTT